MAFPSSKTTPTNDQTLDNHQCTSSNDTNIDNRLNSNFPSEPKGIKPVVKEGEKNINTFIRTIDKEKCEEKVLNLNKFKENNKRRNRNINQEIESTATNRDTNFDSEIPILRPIHNKHDIQAAGEASRDKLENASHGHGQTNLISTFETRADNHQPSAKRSNSKQEKLETRRQYLCGICHCLGLVIFFSKKEPQFFYILYAHVDINKTFFSRKC